MERFQKTQNGSKYFEQTVIFMQMEDEKSRVTPMTFEIWMVFNVLDLGSQIWLVFDQPSFLESFLLVSSVSGRLRA